MKNLKYTFLIAQIATFFVSSTNAQLAIPEFSEDKYQIEVANIFFEVTPAIGARFSSLKIDDSEILYIEEGSGNWGSSFWPSPQSVWFWPPPYALDEDTYSGGIIENKIWLTSNIDRETNLSFSKTIYGDLADTSINIVYVMINKKNEPQSYAPWEVTRVKPDGITFFPAGDSEVIGDMAGSTMTIDDFVWYDNSNSFGMKFFSDSKGWLAHVDKERNLFIKVFDDISIENTAREEGEVEVYSGGNYVELENQGEYKAIAVNDSVSWQVKWLVRQLPANIDVNLGSESLINFTLNVINKSLPSLIKNRSIFLFSYMPNPTNEKINVTFWLQNKEFINVALFNLSGTKVKQLYEGLLFEGEQHFTWNVKQNANDKVSSGIYVLKVQGSSFGLAKKLIVK